MTKLKLIMIIKKKMKKTNSKEVGKTKRIQREVLIRKRKKIELNNLILIIHDKHILFN